jgi:hypothetical protein
MCCSILSQPQIDENLHHHYYATYRWILNLEEFRVDDTTIAETLDQVWCVCKLADANKIGDQNNYSKYF